MLYKDVDNKGKYLLKCDACGAYEEIADEAFMETRRMPYPTGVKPKYLCSKCFDSMPSGVIEKHETRVLLGQIIDAIGRIEKAPAQEDDIMEIGEPIMDFIENLLLDYLSSYKGITYPCIHNPEITKSWKVPKEGYVIICDVEVSLECSDTLGKRSIERFIRNDYGSFGASVVNKLPFYCFPCMHALYEKHFNFGEYENGIIKYTDSKERSSAIFSFVFSMKSDVRPYIKLVAMLNLLYRFIEKSDWDKSLLCPIYVEVIEPMKKILSAHEVK